MPRTHLCPAASHVPRRLFDNGTVFLYRNRSLMCGPGAFDRALSADPFATCMVCYRADHLRCYLYSAAHHPVKKEASGSRAEKTAFLKKVVVSNCLYRQSIHIFPHSPCRSQAAFSEYSSRGSASFSEEYQKHSAAFCPYSALFPWYPGQAMP